MILRSPAIPVAARRAALTVALAVCALPPARTAHAATQEAPAFQSSPASVEALPAVTQRRPGPADAAPPYAQDQHWLDGAGQSWAMREQPDHSAVWLYEEPVALPLDQIGVNGLVAAYGTRRLSALYAGPAFNVARGSDGAAVDIAFLPGGGPDEATFAGFCANTECRIVRWYDQSGNGNDATQDNPRARPALRLSHRVGNALSVIWDFETTSGAPPRWLDLPLGVSLDTGSMGLLWTGRFHNASMISPLIELGTDADPYGFGFWDAHGDFYLGEASHLSEVAGHAALTPAIGLVSASPAGVVTNYRNRLLEIDRIASARHSGGAIGRTVAFKQYGMMELSSLILYGRPLSQADRFYGLQSLGQTFAIAQQQQNTFVVDGDSISQGIASLYLQSYQRDMERLLLPGFVFYDAAWAGKRLSGPEGLLARFAPFTSRLYNPYGHSNILALLAGTNDLQNGETAQEIFALLRHYATAARAAGFRFVTCTVMPRHSFSVQMEAERRSLNAMIVAGWHDFADGLVDLAADPILGPTASLNDGNVYITDGIHLTDYGYQKLASDMAEVVNRLIALPVAAPGPTFPAGGPAAPGVPASPRPGRVVEGASVGPQLR